MLGQPALVAAHGGGDAQRKALLAQQGVAAVARAIAPDFARLGVVDDVLGLVAGPAGLVLLAFGQGRAHGVDARHELAFHADHVIHGTAHAGHDLHVDGHIGAVGQLHAHVGDGRAQRTHGEGNHIHGAAGHAAVEQRLQRGAHLVRGHPVVGRACVFLVGRADVGAVLDARHIGRIGPGQVAAGALDGIELLEGAGIDELLAQLLVFLLRAIAPMDFGGLAQCGHLGHPGDQAAVLDIGGGLDVQALHDGCVHRGASFN
ncbi:MAG: hypothetical protein GAK34_00760 [Delftia tsuruhatensis]|nr:MAG: hypothetical protein GAK34_00760 [Delftia tsuruhatensis]